MNEADMADRPDGIESFVGEAAAVESARERLAHDRGDVPNPLETIVERIKTTGRPELALDLISIDAALALQKLDGVSFGALRRELQGVGVAVGQWDAALKKRGKRLAEQAKSEEQEAERARREARLTAAMESVDPKPDDVEPLLAHHYGSTFVNGTTYRMMPGRVWMERPGKDDIEVTELANFSAPIVRNLLDYSTPGALPERKLVMSVLHDGAEKPREIEVAADKFARMEWPEHLINSRAGPTAGRGIRDNLRVALSRLSPAEDARRYAYTGWVQEKGSALYVHAGGGIGARGVVPGILAVPVSPINEYIFPPPPTGEALTRCAVVVVELLLLEPAGAVLPVVAQQFRAASGDSGASVHLYGRTGIGKSLLGAFGLQFFAPTFNEDRYPLSWRAGGGDSAPGMLDTLCCAGACTVGIDDFKLGGGHKDVELMAKADKIFSAVFGRKGRRMSHQSGKARVDPAPRSTVLSTGEVLPRAGNSLVQRIVPVMLRDRLSGRRGDHVREIRARGREGELARFMAAFIQWTAGHRDAGEDKLEEREARAASQWNLGSNERAARLFGALAVGMMALLRFLLELGVDRSVVAEIEGRAQESFRALSAEYDDVAADQDPCSQFVDVIGSLLSSGRCHVTTTASEAPSNPGLFGWKPKGSEGHMTAGGHVEPPDMQPNGAKIGYVDTAERALYLIPKVAFAEVQRFNRETGDVVNVDLADLPRQLFQHDMLARHEHDSPTRRTYLARKSVGGRSITGLLCLKLSAVFGSEGNESASAVPAIVSGVSDASLEEIHEFPDD
jgi:hypothetical protein